jgi:glycosyltransferase involved in cell wall biosynthesis
VRPVKVCHIITMLELGGAQQNTLYTVTHLDRDGFEPLLVAGAEGPLVEEARRSGVRCHFLRSLVRPISPWRDPAALLSLVRLLRRERPEVVHTHSSKAGILGRAAAAIAGVPVIIHSIHGWGFHRDQGLLTNRLFVGLERMAARMTTAFIAVSEANMREGEALGILAEGRVHLIRSGIRLSEFRPTRGVALSEVGLGGRGGGVTVGMVACFKPQKAPLDFVKVAAEVTGRFPETKFVLAGDGELRGEIEELIGRLGLAGRITLLGWRRDIPELMRSFDILLHTSRWEGLPRVFPEAMATGLPVVATRVDGAPEAIQDGVSGILVEPGDVEGMARAVVELIRDPERRLSMGRAGLERVAAWDIDSMVRSQESLYRKLLNEAPTMAI